MREELRKEHNEEKKRHAQDVDELRNDIQTEIDQARRNEEKSLSRIASLEGEVETLRIRSAGARENKERDVSELNELKALISNLRTELRDAELQLIEFNKTCEQEARDKINDVTIIYHDWEAKVSQAIEHNESVKSKLLKDKSELISICESENKRINEKVSSVLNKKDYMIGELKKQLVEYRKKNSHLQEELDIHRIRRLDAEK